MLNFCAYVDFKWARALFQIHYAQEIHENGKFQHFDYGEKENLKRYGQSHPPEYDLSVISSKVALFYAQNDWLAGPLVKRFPS